MLIHQEDPQLYHWKASEPHCVLLPHFELLLLNILLLNHLQSTLQHHHHPLGCHIAQRNPQKSLCIIIQLFFALDPLVPKSVHMNLLFLSINCCNMHIRSAPLCSHLPACHICDPIFLHFHLLPLHFFESP